MLVTRRRASLNATTTSIGSDMATIKELLDAELAAAQQKVQEVEQKIAAIPAEFHSFDSEVWSRLKAFFTVSM